MVYFQGIKNSCLFVRQEYYLIRLSEKKISEESSNVFELAWVLQKSDPIIQSLDNKFNKMPNLL